MYRTILPLLSKAHQCYDYGVKSMQKEARMLLEDKMSTLEATMTMLESMPEEARMMVFRYTQDLFTSRKPESPYEPLSEQKLLDDLALSRQQIAEGKGMNTNKALEEMGKRHGFI